MWSKVQEDYTENGVPWNQGEQKVGTVKSKSSGYISEHDTKVAQQEFVKEIGEEVVGSGDRRLLWLELLTTINKGLPWNEELKSGEYVDFQTLPMDERQVLYIDYVETEYFTDVSKWYTPRVANKYFDLKRYLKARSEGDEVEETEVATDEENLDQLQVGAEQYPGPEGAGWIVELSGHHYYNKTRVDGGLNHIRSTILKFLEEGSVTLPIDSEGKEMRTFKMTELGITYPILALDGGEPRKVKIPNPDVQPTGSPGAGGADMYGGDDMYSGEDMEGGEGGFGGAPSNLPTVVAAADGEEAEEKLPEFFEVKETTFTIQFCWKEIQLSERLAAQEEAAKLKAEADAAAAANAPDVEPVDPSAAEATDGPIDANVVPAGAGNAGA